MNRLSFESAIEQLATIKSSVDDFNKTSRNPNGFIDTCINEIFDAQLDKIKKYVNQLESELRKQKLISNKSNLKIKQKVARTYSCEKKPVGVHFVTEELQECLNDGYHIVMVNKICKGVIEYILEKELMDDD